MEKGRRGGRKKDRKGESEEKIWSSPAHLSSTPLIPPSSFLLLTLLPLFIPLLPPPTPPPPSPPTRVVPQKVAAVLKCLKFHNGPSIIRECSLQWLLQTEHLVALVMGVEETLLEQYPYLEGGRSGRKEGRKGGEEDRKESRGREERRIGMKAEGRVRKLRTERT